MRATGPPFVPHAVAGLLVLMCPGCLVGYNGGGVDATKATGAPDVPDAQVPAAGALADAGADPTAEDAPPQAADGGPVIGSAEPVVSQCQVDAPWWDPAFGRRHRLALPTLGAQAGGLPVRVALDAGRIDYEHTAQDGRDLRFVGGRNEVLRHHVERWQNGGQSEVWVRLPDIGVGSSLDHIWMYYDSPGAPSVEDVAGTYDAGFRAVLHLGEQDGDYLDSAGAARCIWTGSDAGRRDMAGRVGLGIRTGANSGVNCPVDQLQGMKDYTITAWARLTGSADDTTVDYAIVSADDANVPYRGPGIYVRAARRQISVFSEQAWFIANNLEVPLDQWTLLTVRGRVDAVDGRIEARINDGAWSTLVQGDTTSSAVVDGSPIQIGRWDGSGYDGTFNFPGHIDEVQISGLLRSDAYLSAQYRAHVDTLIEYGALQTRCD